MTETKTAATVILALFAVLTLAALTMQAAPQPENDCPEDAVLVWSGEEHSHCVTLDDFAGHDDWSARLGEIQVELWAQEEVE